MKKLFYIILSMILLLSTVSCQKSDEPISVTKTFHGCEFTITLDKGSYKLTDTLKATVSLVNKSGDDVILYSPTLSPYFKILFSEDGKLRFGDGTEAAPDAIKSEKLPMNEKYTDTKEYDLDSPEGSEEMLKADSEWSIKASTTIIIDPDGEKRYEDISVEIVVPH